MAETTEKEMKVVFERPHSLLPVVTNFCPGCPHGIVERLVCEVMDELDIEGETIGVAPVGCSVISYDFFGCDMIEAAHGRAPAVATAVKRVHPDKVVFAYQGDGDLASIGMAETVHAATRGENITIIFINNAIYGMTGGQMAPTSLPNQVTQTSPYGRDVSTAGNPTPRERASERAGRPGLHRARLRPIRRRTCARPKRPSRRPSRTRSTAWATRSSRWSPPVPPTGA